MASVSIFNLTAGTALASADVLPFVDVSDHTQSAEGSTLKITVADFFGTVPAPVVVTSTTAPQLTLAYDGTHSATWTVSSAGALTLNATSTITITPATTVTGLATLNGGATVASGQTLTLTGATITGLTAASVATGTFPGVYTITGALTLSSTLTAASTSAHTLGPVTLTNGAVAGVTTLVTSSTINSQTISSTASFTGTLTVATGLTVSAGGITVSAGSSSFAGDVTLAATQKLFLSATSYIQETATNLVAISCGGGIYFRLINGFGLLYNGANTTNMSNGNIAIGDSAAPTGNPAVGTFFLWSDSSSHAFKGRGTSGTVTTIAAADPHCPICGRDFVVEWENENYGALRVCMWCLTNDHEGKPHVHRVVASGAEAHLSKVRGSGWSHVTA